MKAVAYREIEKQERKRLAAEAMRQPRLRTLSFISIFTAILISRPIGNLAMPAHAGLMEHIGIRVLCAVVVAGLAGSFASWHLRREVEKLKNS
jgi:hypothetical protein